ncbi:MAG TPA: hypothetical protein VG273_16410 [Bryobacteraceae bacterium]|jgi:hypothetical protein|nr:hypothetical protein [Bryobacteraceae bacterium]
MFTDEFSFADEEDRDELIARRPQTKENALRRSAPLNRSSQASDAETTL